jgi:hypothetical protein
MIPGIILIACENAFHKRYGIGCNVGITSAAIEIPG